MSRIIRIWVTDSEYERILKEHTNVQKDIRDFLGCREYNPVILDEEVILQKIKEMEPGTVFSYRDLMDCEYDPEYPGMAGISARKIRTICKESKLVECYGYDSAERLRLYRRL